MLNTGSEIESYFKKVTLTHNILTLLIVVILVIAFMPSGSSCPGQRHYWIVFDNNYPLEPEQQDNNEFSFSSSVISINFFISWWQDYTGTPSAIWEQGWHINMQVDFKTEVSGNNAILRVKMYSPSNFWPEWFNWTVINGVSGDQEFQVALYDGDGNEEFNEIATGSWQSENCGNMNNFSLLVRYTNL